MLTVSDWIELRSADGTCNRAQVKSFELVRFSSEKQAQRSVSGSDSFALRLSHIDRSLIHIGNEVWSVADTGRYLNL